MQPKENNILSVHRRGNVKCPLQRDAVNELEEFRNPKKKIENKVSTF
jgi:hypothetical protein